jgi:hypothetical protein
MPPFRRVDARQAVPTALGILVPPGRRTCVVLRPRPLEWDLLPLQQGMEQVQPAVFAAFEREEAAVVARRVQQALERGAGAGPNPLEVVCSVPGAAYGVCARIESGLWIACQRAVGKVYQPAFFPSAQETEVVAAQLTPFLWPGRDAGQEYYFNTQAFSH